MRDKNIGINIELGGYVLGACACKIGLLGTDTGSVSLCSITYSNVVMRNATDTHGPQEK